MVVVVVVVVVVVELVVVGCGGGGGGGGAAVRIGNASQSASPSEGGRTTTTCGMAINMPTLSWRPLLPLPLRFPSAFVTALNSSGIFAESIRYPNTR